MSKYNIHGGHNRIVSGASALLDEVTEDRKVKDGVISRLRSLGHTAYDCTDDKGRSQGANLANIVAKCNAHTVDVDVSIHLNLGRKDKKGDGKTGGAEVFIYDYELKDLAKAVADAIAEEFGYALRSDETTPSGYAGVKIKKSLYVLRNTKNKAMLVECCFVDDADDAKVWNADRCAGAIVKGLTGKTVSGSSSSSGSSGSSIQSGSTTSSGYDGSSIVDYLKSIGKDSSFAARKKYAEQYGISGYTGTAAQNEKLLKLMKGGVSSGSGSSSSGSGYYKAFSASSIVDGLKAIGVDSSMSNRKKIAAANGIAGYTGTAAQNTKLCGLAKQGKLKKAGASGSGSSGLSYYAKFSSTSIVDGLKSIGVDSSTSNRKKIAAANGISNYTGTAAQNTKLCSLAKQGKLKKA